LSTEANDQPASAGVEGPGAAAQTDDIDTEAFDRAPAPDDDASDPDAATAEGEDDADPDKPAGPEDDLVEVEYEGQKVRVSAAVKDALLRQADYTRKTQEIAEQARVLKEERSTWESQREESRAALPEEHTKLAVLSHNLSAVDKQLETLKAVDWSTWRNQVAGLPDDDPAKLKYAQYRDAYTDARDRRIELVDDLEAAKKDLSTKEAERLAKQQEAQNADLAKRRQETGLALKAEVPGWNKDVAAKVIEFAVGHLGIAPEEMANATDPRTWKLVHEVMTSRAELAALKTTQKQQQTAANHEKAQVTKPAATPKGSGGQVRDPSTARGDGLTAEEWMRRRNAQVAARKRA
jgi:hypothetical protein